MKKIFLTSILILATLSQSLFAQNPTTYFMEGSTFRTKWNPAFAPQRGYINIPVLGGIELSTNGNVALDNLLFVQGGKLSTIFSSSVPTTLALSELESTNRFGESNTINLIGFGAYSPNQKNFWSVAINLRTNVDAQLPYSFFDFMKTGKAQDISGIGFHADCYAEATFTHSFPLAKNLYFGFSGKFLNFQFLLALFHLSLHSLSLLHQIIHITGHSHTARISSTLCHVYLQTKYISLIFYYHYQYFFNCNLRKIGEST